jgi:hypothetical protein
MLGTWVMGLSRIFITVQAKNEEEKNDFVEWPVNVGNILGYPPNENSRFEDAKARIDLNAVFNPDGVHYTSNGAVCSSLFTKESPAEIAQLIENAQDSYLQRAKKNGIVLVM